MSYKVKMSECYKAQPNIPKLTHDLVDHSDEEDDNIAATQPVNPDETIIHVPPPEPPTIPIEISPVVPEKVTPLIDHTAAETNDHDDSPTEVPKEPALQVNT